MHCILFDNDGTLVQSEQLCCEVMARQYKQEKDINLDPKQLFLRFRGWQLTEIFDALALETGIQWDNDFVVRYRKNMYAVLEQDLQPTEGIDTALQKLPHTKAVVSNAPLRKIQLTLRTTKLDQHFNNHYFSAFEIESWKPDPKLYLYAADAMGFQPENCFVVEDSLVGVQGAIAAGMKTFFYSKFGDRYEHENVIEFDSMLKLPELIYSHC